MRVKIRLIIKSKNIYTPRPFFNRNKFGGKSYRLNQQIRVPEVRVIDDAGEQLGIMSTVEALRLAEERGVDLIEVSPQAQPPVCRLMEFGKFQYQQSRQAKNKTKRVDVKGIRLSLKIGQHDIETKQKQVAKFLEQGHKVKIDLRLRGREKAFRNNGIEVVKQFIETLNCEYKLDKPIDMQMGTISAIIAKK